MPYHDLFCLSKVVQWVSVQLHLAQLCDGHKLLGDNLGRIEKIETKAKLVLFFHDLDTKLREMDLAVDFNTRE